MRRKIFVLILTLVFVLTQVSMVDAKGFSRRSSFGGSSHSKSSSGYTGYSKSSSRSNSSSSKSSGNYSGSSSSRNVPGSYSSSSSSKRTSTKNSSRKSAYMQDAYKKQASSNSYNAYKQKLNTEQQKAYDSSMKTNYKVNNRMNFEEGIRTRSQRISNFNSRPVYINIRPGLFGGPMSWGMAYVGVWDLFFIMHASDLFWYHHWNEINPYRDYFEQEKFAEMEARIKQLERENNGIRDANYLDPNTDPDLQFSSQYQEKHLDNVYYSNKYDDSGANPIVAIIFIIIIAGVLIVVISKVARPKQKKTYNSRIY